MGRSALQTRCCWVGVATHSPRPVSARAGAHGAAKIGAQQSVWGRRLRRARQGTRSEWRRIAFFCCCRVGSREGASRCCKIWRAGAVARSDAKQVAGGAKGEGRRRLHRDRRWGRCADERRLGSEWNVGVRMEEVAGCLYLLLGFLFGLDVHDGPRRVVYVLCMRCMRM